MRRILSGALAIGLAFPPSSAEAVSGAAPYLSIRPSARAAAMGGASSALIPTDTAASQSNPALLGLIERPLFSTSSGSLNLNQDLYYGGAVVPFRWGSVNRDFKEKIFNNSTENRMGQWFLPQDKIRFAFYGAGTFLSVDEIERRSEFGVAQGSFKNSEKNIEGGFGLRLYDNLSLGFSGRTLRQTLADASASGRAMSAGLWYRIPQFERGQLNVGLGMRDMAGKLKWEVPDPDLVRTDKYDEKIEKKTFLGLGFTPPNSRWSTALDWVKPKEQSSRIQLGLEWKAAPAFSLRAGWDDGNPSAGIGLGFERSALALTLDYAFVYDANDLANQQWLTLNARVGRGVREENDYKLIKEKRPKSEDPETPSRNTLIPASTVEEKPKEKVLEKVEEPKPTVAPAPAAEVPAAKTTIQPKPKKKTPTVKTKKAGSQNRRRMSDIKSKKK